MAHSAHTGLVGPPPVSISISLSSRICWAYLVEDGKVAVGAEVRMDLPTVHFYLRGSLAAPA